MKRFVLIKMHSKSLWVFIFAVLLNSFATSENIVLENIVNGEKCTPKIDVYGIKVGKLGIAKLGAPGEKAPEGPQGLKGPIGAQGPAGTPGTAGTCGCKSIESKHDWFERGKKETPAGDTCRMGFRDENGLKYLYLGGMEVNCDSTTQTTCPTINTKGKNVTYTEQKPFWLTEKYITVKEMYGLEVDQLLWLQRKSIRAKQTIRFHCKNSNPVGEHALTLLTWNDKVVGPTPTESKPFHYDIVNDGCSGADEDTWSFTDIILDSPVVDRLPIIDFYIKDVRNGNQELRIEILELCFV